MPVLYSVPDTALSVAGITTYIQSLLEEDPQLHRVWVTGEVSSASDRHGHIFFTLQEPDGSAAIQAVVWRSRRSTLTTLPIPGEQVLLLGQVRVYAQRGQYQLVTVQLLPAGAGLQALRRRQLEQRLAAEGLFDEARKRPLPPYPHCIAVVTSPQAAAWGDIQQTLQHRQPGLSVLLSPAIVQGAQAPAAIAQALSRVATDGRAELVIVARGGGAREDLECFDQEEVVRAIATSPIPVITGIGHEQDETLTDRVADVQAHTPTAAAEQAVPHIDTLWAVQSHYLQRVRTALRTAVQVRHNQVTNSRSRLEQLRLDRTVNQETHRLAWLQQRLQQAMEYRLQTARKRCEYLQQTLQTLDPTSVLKRGYAVVRHERQHVLTSVQNIEIGDMLHIQLSQGDLCAKVLQIEADAATELASTELGEVQNST